MMLCDMCGYKGEIDKNEPKYLSLFDVKVKEQFPEQCVSLLREIYICSKCRKLLLGFIDTKRIESGLNPIMDYEKEENNHGRNL